MTTTAVLFDLDGTLLDTAPDFETATNRLLAENNKPALLPGSIRHLVGNGSAQIVTQAFGVERDKPEFKALQLGFLEHYRNCLVDKTRLFTGLETSLEYLDKSQIPWGIVTNKPLEYAKPIVKALLPSSQVLVCPDHVEIAKPDPDGILLACSTIDQDPESCLYVGDHLRDIQAAKAAGSKSVAVGWGYIGDEEEHTEWGADWCVAKSENLTQLLQELFAN